MDLTIIVKMYNTKTPIVLKHCISEVERRGTYVCVLSLSEHAWSALTLCACMVEVREGCLGVYVCVFGVQQMV